MVQTSLKLISDSDNLVKETTTSKNNIKKTKNIKTVRRTNAARKLQTRNQRSRRVRPNAKNRNRRRTAGVARFASDKEILDIHRRSLVSARGDHQAPNVRQRAGTECDFYAEFEPFYYTTLTRTASTTIHFSSNCMTRTTINVETVFGRNRLINWNYHPTRLFLNIFGNVYEVRYSSPRVIDRHDMMRSLRYTRGSLWNSFGKPFNLNLPRQNSVYLAPQVAGSYNNFNMRRFRSLRGHWGCQMRPRRFSDYAGRIRRRRIVIQRLRTRGYSTREIRNLIGRRRFNPTGRVVHDELAEILSEANNFKAKKSQTYPPVQPHIVRPHLPQSQPRNLKIVDRTEEDNVKLEEGLSDKINNVERKTQGIRNKVSGEQTVPKGRANPTGSRRRTRRQKRRRGIRTEASMTPFEIQEERQRREERTFILNRLSRNFIHELVMVCTLR